MLNAECHELADKVLRRLVNTKKLVVDSESQDSSSEEGVEQKGVDFHSEISDDDSDKYSDSMSVDSDRTFFRFNKEEA